VYSPSWAFITSTTRRSCGRRLTPQIPKDRADSSSERRASR
jgi:hypothetical protein